MGSGLFSTGIQAGENCDKYANQVLPYANERHSIGNMTYSITFFFSPTVLQAAVGWKFPIKYANEVLRHANELQSIMPFLSPPPRRLLLPHRSVSRMKVALLIGSRIDLSQ